MTDIRAYLKDLTSLVNVDCGSYNPAGVSKIADKVSTMVASLPGKWYKTQKQVSDKVGPALLFTNTKDPTYLDIVFLCHMDTVFSQRTVDKRPFSEDDKKAYGPGVSDMKCGIVNLIYALRGVDINVLQILNIGLLFSPDEEISSRFSKEFTTDIAKKSTYALVMESSPSGNLTKGRYGSARYIITLKGKAAHGSTPEKGVSALEEAGHWTHFLNKLGKEIPDAISNVGMITGGKGFNLVPDKAEILFEMRFLTQQACDQLTEVLQEKTRNPFHPEISVNLHLDAFKPPFIANEQKAGKLWTMAKKAAKEAGIFPEFIISFGGSDGNLASSAGAITLDSLGCKGGGFHAETEYIEIDSIVPRITMVEKLIAYIAEEKAKSLS